MQAEAQLWHLHLHARALAHRYFARSGCGGDCTAQLCAAAGARPPFAPPPASKTCNMQQESCSTAQHSTSQHSTAQRSTAQQSIAQHSTAQHSGVHTATGAQHNVRHRIHHARYFFCACRVTSADSRTHIPTRVVRWAVEENLKLAHALQKLRARLQAWPQRVQPELEAIAEYPVVPRSALAFPQTKPQCCAYGVQ